MKWKLARFALLLLLAMTVAIRSHAVVSRDALTDSFDTGSAIKALLRESGFSLRRNPAEPPSVLSGAVYFQRPDCALPSIVMPFALNYEALPYLRRIAPQAYALSYIYLDGVWPVQYRVLMFIKWFRYAMLDVVGLGRFLPVKTAVVLAEPADCRSDAVIDWRLIWDRAWNRNHVVGRGQSRDRTGYAAASAHARS